jgi:dGTPase
MHLPAPYAADPARSLGRIHPEGEPEGRSEFQRDRDRIVHCGAFRRLEYKTQVFVNHEGDLFRTRLTHSIEVAQIARTVARRLRLEEDLTEAISLAHDLGHTPFGHAGQDALNRCMQPHGGFEHNLQSLRVVDELEERYGAHDGLNLCFETREGVLKHCSVANAQRLGPLGRRFLEHTRPSLEAQLANVADEIAYVNHDVDDGIRSGLLTVAQLMEVELFADHHRQAIAAFPQAGERRQVHETVRRMINELVLDLTRHSAGLIAAAAPRSIDDVRAAPPLIAFSLEVGARSLQLKRFLFDIEGGADRHRAVPGLRRRSPAAADRAPAQGGARPVPGDRRLHRRHDRSLRDQGASAAVRGRRRLIPAWRARRGRRSPPTRTT